MLRKAIVLGLTVASLSSFSALVSASALADVTQLIGQDASSDMVYDFARQMGCAQRGNYFKCMQKGVEFKIDTGWLKVTSLWLYADGVDGYAAFRGKIPLGLQWGMTPQQVAALLGPSPDGIHYRFSNLPFKAELSYYTPGQRLGRVLFTMKEY